MTPAGPRRLMLMLEYDGVAYRGSQVQRGLPTIQGELAQALYLVTGERPRLTFAGRTDAGVHARGQVASAMLDSSLGRERLVAGLNHYLPDSIAVQEARWVPLDFDVRRRPARRCYRYTIVNTPQRSPLGRGQAHHVAEPLDAAAMDAAIRCQVGRWDRSPFVGSAGLGGRSTLRTIYRARAWREGDLVHVELEGDAFLPHQVRRTVGALVQVGRGQLSAQDFCALARGQGSGRVAPAAPPQGLCLMKVVYMEGLGGCAGAASLAEEGQRGPRRTGESKYEHV